MDFKAILGGFLATAYKMPQAEIDSLLDESKPQDEVQASILAKDASRIQPFLQKFTEGQNLGKKTYATELENTIKKQHGVESDLQGAELINHIIAAKSTTQIGDDAVKTSKVYQQLLADKTNAEKELQSKLEQQEANFTKRQNFANTFEKVLMPAFSEAGYILPPNPNLAARLQGDYRNELAKYDFREDGFVYENDKVLNDNHGNPIPAKAFVANKASEFGFDVKNNGMQQSPLNGKDKTGTGAGAKKFKDKAEFAAYLQDQSVSLADKEAATKEFYKGQ